MIKSNYEPVAPMTSNLTTQYDAYFAGSIVEGKFQVSSYLDGISNDNIASFDRKTVFSHDPRTTIDVVSDRNTQKSYYKVGLNLTHRTTETGNLTKEQHIKDSDFQTMVLSNLLHINDQIELQDEIDDFKKKVSDLSFCKCHQKVLMISYDVAQEVKEEVLKN